MSETSSIMIFKLLVAACVFVSGFANTVDNCPSRLPRNKYVKVFGNKCYRFLANRKREFVDAQDYCRYYGGQLVQPKTKSINDFVRKTMKSYGRYGNKKNLWIGLQYDYDDKDFLWEDGSHLDFHNFGTAQKAKWNDCAFMKVKSGNWFTHDCNTNVYDSAKHYFVCEYPLLVPTEQPKHHQISTNDCPRNLTRDKFLQTYGQTCYRFVVQEKDFKTFQDAQQDCEKDGGNLALVTSENINRFLEKQLGETNETKKAWIGLRYDDSINNYKWVDGTPLAYFHENFHSGEYRARDDCVAINADGSWFVRVCDDDKTLHEERPYICEYNTPSTTVTPSIIANRNTDGITPQVLSTTDGFANNNDNCPSRLPRNKYVKVFGNKCYRFLANRKREFDEAQDYCMYYGGQLVLPKSKSINNFLRETMRSYGDYTEEMWIGLRYDDDERGFLWEDGSQIDFDNFGQAQKTVWDGCAFMKVNTGKWFTHECNVSHPNWAKHYFACEYPLLVPTKEPKYPPISTNDCPRNLARDQFLQTYGQMCYRFVVQKKDFKTFQDAQQDCEKDGGNLVLVTSDKINRYLEEQLGDINATNKMWIGLRYDDNINNYKWVDGTPLAYFHENFHYGQYRAREECVAMNADGFWFVRECDDDKTLNGERPYICEYTTLSPQQHTTSRSTINTPSTTVTPSITTNRNTDGTTPQTPVLSTTQTNTDTTGLNTPEMVSPEFVTPVTTPKRPEITTGERGTFETTLKTPHVETTPKTSHVTIAERTTSVMTSKTSKENIMTVQSTETSVTQTTPSTQTTISSTEATQTRQKTTCPSIVCDMDCGFDGYNIDQQTGCMECKCNFK